MIPHNRAQLADKDGRPTRDCDDRFRRLGEVFDPKGAGESLMSAKQDKLVSTGNIKSINGTSILGSGDLTISGGGGGVATAVDDLNSTTDITFWSGTQAQYDALGSYTAGRMYIITDATSPVDPWTYVKLGSDFTTTSSSAVDITGMAFTPAASKSYEFEACLLTRTATATVGPRPGLAWPTGMTDGVVEVRIPSAAGTQVMQFGNINAAVLAPVGGLPNTTQSYKATIIGMVIAGASPSGTVKIQLASETAGTTVTVKAGSYLRYRKIP